MSGRRRAQWMAVLLVSAAAAVGACKRKDAPHQHAAEHPEGHDHHAEGHGHGEGPVVRLTRWSDTLELFAEHPAAVSGEEVTLLAHVTVLENFRPLARGAVQLELEGPAKVGATANAPVRPGIYELRLTPPQPGRYRGTFSVEASDGWRVEGVELQVFPSEAAAKAAVRPPEDDRFIELLKEQQWGIPFATAFAFEGAVVPSIEVAGTVDTPPGGFAEIGAPVAGRVVAPQRGLPRPGQAVRKGEVLAQLAPTPSSPEDAAKAGLAVTEAEARVSEARAAVARAERLIEDEAISQKEVEDARRELAVAQEAVQAARRGQALYSGATGGRSGGGAGGSWPLTSPINGTVVEVRAKPGAAVAQGETLFSVVNVSELWIRARVPEQDAARLRTESDASYQIAGLDTWAPIDVTGPDASASVVTVGRVVDPQSRTVDVLYALKKEDPRLRVGGLVRVSLPAGDAFEGVVVPRSALVEEDGRTLVYVQVDGEHFEERQVRVGPRQGNRVGIMSGVAAGERVVTLGANVVRLSAGAGKGETPHGHIH